MENDLGDYNRFLGNNRCSIGDMIILKRRVGEARQKIHDLQNSQAALDDIIQDLTLVRRWLSERWQDLRQKNKEIDEALLEYDTCSVYLASAGYEIGQKITSIQKDVDILERCQVEIDMLRGTVQHGYFEDICKDMKAEKPKDEVVGNFEQQFEEGLQI